MSENERYAKGLAEGSLDHGAINRVIKFMRDKEMTCSLEEGEELKKKTGYKIKLPVYTVRVDKRWQGLAVGFPGTKDDLSTESVGTPWLRLILYPIIKMFKQFSDDHDRKIRNLYLMGSCFNDVFLRKFEFLKFVVPNVIILTDDLLKCHDKKAPAFPPPKTDKKCLEKETYYQASLINQMQGDSGLEIPIGERESIRVKYVAHEVRTVEGTIYPERLDILGYDVNDKSLVAFEIKGPRAGRVELENLFFQGLEHRDWLERNKLAVKFVLDDRADGQIDARKRVKLVLGFCGDCIPDLFHYFRDSAMASDPYLKIGFCRLAEPSAVGEHVKVLRYNG
mgnify:CR=1 FL=1